MGNRHTGWYFLKFFLYNITNDEVRDEVETDTESLECVKLGDDRGKLHDGDDDKGKSPVINKDSDLIACKRTIN